MLNVIQGITETFEKKTI